MATTWMRGKCSGCGNSFRCSTGDEAEAESFLSGDRRLACPECGSFETTAAKCREPKTPGSKKKEPAPRAAGPEKSAKPEKENHRGRRKRCNCLVCQGTATQHEHKALMLLEDSIRGGTTEVMRCVDRRTRQSVLVLGVSAVNDFGVSVFVPLARMFVGAPSVEVEAPGEFVDPLRCQFTGERAKA
jgi:DNA-directed RNA polymerase subunit RPC12/RpoP